MTDITDINNFGIRPFKFKWSDLGNGLKNPPPDYVEPEYYGLFEVYLDNNGNIITYSTAPEIWAESMEELQEELEYMLNAARNLTPIDLKELNERLNKRRRWNKRLQRPMSTL